MKKNYYKKQYEKPESIVLMAETCEIMQTSGGGGHEGAEDGGIIGDEE